MPAVPDQGSSDKADIDRAKQVQENFIIMLRNYIHENALKQTILQQTITEIWVCEIIDRIGRGIGNGNIASRDILH